MGDFLEGDLQVKKPVYEIKTPIQESELKQGNQQIFEEQNRYQNMQEQQQGRRSVDLSHDKLEEQKLEQVRMSVQSNMPPKYEKKVPLKEERNVVPLEQIHKLPIAQDVRPMSKEEVAQRREIFNDRAKKLHEEALRNLNITVPEDRDHLVEIRRNMLEEYKFFDEKHVEHGDYRWKEEVPQEIRDHFEWIMEYYKIQDDSFEAYHEEGQVPVRLPLKKYQASVDGVDSIYEKQDTNNCFCCSGTAMLNQFIRNHNKEEEPTRRFSQTDMRAYRPQIKKYDPAGGRIMNEAQRQDYINEINRYTGADKTTVGNVFEMGDFFLDNLQGEKAMLNKMYFQMPPMNKGNKEKDLLKSNNMKAVFLDKISEVLATGNVVSFLEVDGAYGHYLTITGIDGDMISYLDSNKGDLSQTTQTKGVDEFLKRLDSKGNPIEIAWLSEMKSPEELTREYSNLNYNAKTGYSLKKENADSIQNVSHVKGIAVRKEMGDMGPGMDGITQVAYIPNPLAVAESESIEEAQSGTHTVSRSKKKEAQKEEPKEGQKEKEEQKQAQKENEAQKEEQKEKEAQKKEQKEAQNEAQKQEQKSSEQKLEQKQEEDEIDEEAQIKEQEKLEKQKQQYEDYKERKNNAEYDAAIRRQERAQEKAKDQKAVQEKAKKEQEIWDIKEQIAGSYESKDKTQKKADKKLLSEFEKKSKDYETFGVGFTLDKVKVTAADSKTMRNLKVALEEYLKIRQEIFAAHNFKEDHADAENIFKKEKDSDLIQNTNQHKLGRYYGLKDDERELLGNAYEAVNAAVKDYYFNHNQHFAFGRGRARYSQVKRIKEQLTMDNAKFFLSSERRSILKTIDVKYADHSSVRKEIMPTWHKLITTGDYIDVENQKYRNKRREQKATGTLPPWYKRAMEWTGRGMKNNVARLAMAYHGIGGLVDRTLGLGTMLAANSLTFAGKVVKAPIKLLSGIFNGASKYIFRSKKRWKVDYSLTKGWKSVDDGRRIFRKYLKGVCVLPAAVTETVTRGIPYIFGHHFKSGVYKRTGRWAKAIAEDVKDVMKGLGAKDYGAADRADEDYRQAGGITLNAEGKVVKHGVPDYEDEEADFEEQMAQLEAMKNVRNSEEEAQELQEKDEKKQEQKKEEQKHEGKGPEGEPKEEQKQEQKQEGKGPEGEPKEEQKQEQKNEGKGPEGEPKEEQKQEQKQEGKGPEGEPKEEQKQEQKNEGKGPEGELKEEEQKQEGQKEEQKQEQKQEADLKQRQEEATLKDILNREAAEQLLKNQKTFGDSATMTSIKNAVRKVEQELEGDGRLLTEYDITALLASYEDAIYKCKNYLDNKKHNSRWELVNNNYIRLMDEASRLRVARGLFREGILDGMTGEKAMKPKEILFAARVYGLSKTGFDQAGEAQKRELPTEETLDKLTPLASSLHRAFSGKEQPADLIARLKKSKKKEDLALAQELTHAFPMIREILGEFTEGKVCDRTFMLGGELISLTQNTAGQLTLTAGGRNLNLERHSGGLKGVLETNIVQNEAVYGRNASEDVIRAHVSNLRDFKDSPKERRLLLDFLSRRTGYKATDFDNFATFTLTGMAMGVLAGKQVIIGTPAEIEKRAENSEELCYSNMEKQLINVSATRDMLKETLKEENRKKVTEKVTMAKKQEAGAEQEQWDEKEQKVKDFLSDLIFSYDTWDTDEKLLEPGERIKKVLLRNKEALSYLIADMYKSGDKKLELVNSIKKKLPLAAMGDGASEEIDKLLDDAVNTVIAAIDKEIGDRVKEVLPQILERKAEKAREKAEKEAKKKEEDDGLFSWLGAKFSNIVEDAAGKAEDLLLDQIDTEEKLAAFIKRTISNPETVRKGFKIKTGKEEQGIPSIEEIISGMETGVFAEAERSLDAGVDAASVKIQETVSKYAGQLFSPAQAQEQEQLKDENEQGITKKEKRRRKKKRIESENMKLGQMVKDSMVSGTKGQGMFTRLVFENYFKGVDTMDKRSMIGSMIKNAKPMPQLLAAKENETPKEKEAREAYNNNVTAQSMGNYIGGILKGAGPLFQKMMQGLPTAGLPTELQGAVEDMKSKLAPIPDEVVEAELYNMVQSSNGQIKAIEVVKPLGAASVGQTFLCKLTRADGTREDVAVKLLKPDVRNRMMREKKLMIRCARMTDEAAMRERNKVLADNEKGGMQTTYEGQLQRIEEELDLTIEARNVELGKIYDKTDTEAKKKVSSMKLNHLVAPTTNSMVLQKAPGETIDSLLKRTRKELEDAMSMYLAKDKDGKPIMKKDANGNEEYELLADNQQDLGADVLMDQINPGSPDFNIQLKKADPGVIVDKLTVLLADLKKKKKYLQTFAEEWVQEGVFKEGFYHGDPHDGNIMIDESGLTVIDFGNCTKIEKEHQEHVTKMLFASSVGDVEAFRHGFHMLLRPEFEAVYQQQKDRLTEEFKKVFQLGDTRSAGARIAVALLKAQELGLEVPSSVYNFSQGQIRLQNTIDNMNREIETVEKYAGMFMHSENLTSDYFALTDKQREADRRVLDPEGNQMNVARRGYVSGMVRYASNARDFRYMFENYGDNFEHVMIEPLQDAVKYMPDTIKEFIRVANEAKGVALEERDKAETMKPLIVPLSRVSAAVPGAVMKKIENLLRKEEIRDEVVNEIVETLKNAADSADLVVKDYEKLDALEKKILKKHGDTFEPDEEENAAFDQAIGKFMETYRPLQAKKLYDDTAYANQMNRLTGKSFLDLEKSMTQFFEKYPARQAEFMEKYNAVQEAKQNEIDKSDPAAYDALVQSLSSIYLELMFERIKEKDQLFEEAAKSADDDFLSVMAEVIDKESKQAVGRVGIFKSLGYKIKLDRAKKEKDKMDEAAKTKDD